MDRGWYRLPISHDLIKKKKEIIFEEYITNDFFMIILKKSKSKISRIMIIDNENKSIDFRYDLVINRYHEKWIVFDRADDDPRIFQFFLVNHLIFFWSIS